MALEQPTEEEQAQIDFDAGAAADQPLDTKPAVAPEAKPVTQEPVAQPEAQTSDYIQITRDQFAAFDASARRTVALEQQISRAFGTLGDIQQIVRNLQAATPRGTAVEIPKDAFADMAREFPEMADMVRRGVETALQGVTGTAQTQVEADPVKLQAAIDQQVLKLEKEALEDAYPDWMQITGAVDMRQGHQPDPNNAYRRWLASKDGAYQQKVNATSSASVLTRSIQLFQNETRPKAAPAKQGGNLKQRFFASRAREAIQPRGDGGRAVPTTADDDFEKGFYN